MCTWCDNVCKGAPSGSIPCKICSKCNYLWGKPWDYIGTIIQDKDIDIKYQNEMVQDYLDQCAGGKPTTWIQIDEKGWEAITHLSRTHNLTHREVFNKFVLPAAQKVIDEQS